jgi:hypothetical protein
MRRIVYFLMLSIIISSCQETLFEDETNNQVYIFDTYWKEIDRNYSFFSYSHVDWDSLYLAIKPTVAPTIPDDSLFNILASATSALHDAHTNIYSPQGIGGNIDYFERYRANEITLDTDLYFESYTTGRIFEYGKLKNNNTGYIKIKTFDGAAIDFEKVGVLFNLFAETDKIILDVRSNFGGKISNSQIVADHMADSKRYVGQYRIRNGPDHEDFSEWINLFVSPPANTIPVKKPVTILTNRRSFSATEWFILFADALPNVRVMGDTTGGGSAMPVFRELPNGWLLRISNTQIKTPSGRDFQNTGLFPDVPVWITVDDEKNGRDTILEIAML